MNDFEEGKDVKDLRRNYAEGVKTGDVDRIVTWAGAGVGLLSRVQPAMVSDCKNISRFF